MRSVEEVPMLSKELLAAVVLIFVIAVIIGGPITGSSVGSTEQNTLQVLMSPFENFVRFTGITWVAGVLPFPKLEFPWAGALWQVLTLDLALFTTSTLGGYVRLGIYALLGVALAFGIGMWVIGVIRGSG